MSEHAVLSPSSAVRWKNCTGAVAATRGCKDSSNKFAREGTAGHQLAEMALGYERRADFWLGESIDIGYEENGVGKVDIFTVDDEMAASVQVYVDQVMREPGELIVEESVCLDDVYGVKDQFGTADAIVLDHEHKRMYVGDLKMGRGVQVYADGNDQLYSYAAGAMLLYDMIEDWETITVAIHQPRLNHYDEHTLTRVEMDEWIAETSIKAKRAVALIGADPAVIEEAKTPGEKQCQWCPIKGSCLALASWTHSSVFADFTTLSAEPTAPRNASELDNALLGELMGRVKLIQDTVSEWRAEGLRRVQAGIDVPGWKMVEGRAGARKWSDEDEAKKVMKANRMRNDEIYTQKLLTAPAAEKLIAKKKPKVWTKLKLLVTQAAGKPSLAPESDNRPAVKVATADAFKNEGDISDLL